MNLRNLQANEGYRNFHEMLMKELEWGINTDTNTLYLAGDIGGETLHSGAIHMDILHRFNPKGDINLNINVNKANDNSSMKKGKMISIDDMSYDDIENHKVENYYDWKL